MKTEKTKEKASFVKDILITVIAPLLLAFILFRIVFWLVIVPTSSMSPTIEAGDITLMLRAPYSLGIGSKIDKGDVAVFYSEEQKLVLCKRVIATAGDTVELKDGKVYVNGEELYEPYVMEGSMTEPGDNGLLKFVVPDGHYFLLGDNRTGSFDSRFWEKPYIPKEQIKGYIIGKNFSFS